jgi:hypothetical protein
MDQVYVLRLASRDAAGRPRVYVGRAADPDARVQAHRAGGPGAASWVRLHGGVVERLAPLTPAEPSATWELRETLAQMRRHGLDNVRGYEWTDTRPLGRDACLVVRTLAMGQADLCRRCGAEGHYRAQCTAQRPQAWLCDLRRRVAAAEGSTRARAALRPRPGPIVRRRRRLPARAQTPLRSPAPAWRCDGCGGRFATETAARVHARLRCRGAKATSGPYKHLPTPKP